MKAIILCGTLRKEGHSNTATLSVMIKEHGKDQYPSEEQLLKIYREKYDKTARKMAQALFSAVRELHAVA